EQTKRTECLVQAGFSASNCPFDIVHFRVLRSDASQCFLTPDGMEKKFHSVSDKRILIVCFTTSPEEHSAGYSKKELQRIHCDDHDKVPADKKANYTFAYAYLPEQKATPELLNALQGL